MSAGVIVLPRNSRNRENFNDFYTIPAQAVRDAEYGARMRLIVAARVEARFGADSDVARMLGLVNN